MLTDEQQKTVDLVLKRFQDFDDNAKWTKIDDYMAYLEYLGDEQLAIEASLIFEKHKFGEPRCKSQHKKVKCLVPSIMEAVDGILDQYEDIGCYDAQCRYVLQYFLTLTATGDIIS